MQFDSYSLEDDYFNALISSSDGDKSSIYQEVLSDWMDEILAPNSNPLMTDAVANENIVQSFNNDERSAVVNHENRFELGDNCFEASSVQTRAYDDEITIETHASEKECRQIDLFEKSTKNGCTLPRFDAIKTNSSGSRQVEKVRNILHPDYDDFAINPCHRETQNNAVETDPINDSAFSYYEGLPFYSVDSTNPQIYHFSSQSYIDGSVDSFPLTPPGSNNSSDTDLHAGIGNVNYSMNITPSSSQMRRSRPRAYDNSMLKYDDRLLLGSSYLHRSTAPPRHSGRFSDYFQQSDIHQGTLMLTEDEKRALLAEGYPIPSRLPLTKTEERNLKKIRRKIKNKISAQESRRKKKEYMEILEKKVEVYSQENHELRYRLDYLETSNRSLLSQLRHLQQTVNRSGLGPALGPGQTFFSPADSQDSPLHSTMKTHRSSPSGSTTGTPFMALFLCFALIFSGATPPFGSLNETKQSMTSFQGGISVPSLYSLSFVSQKEEYKLSKDYNKNINNNTTRPFLPHLDTGIVDDISSSSKYWCSEINCVTLPRIEDQLGKSRLLDTISEQFDNSMSPGINPGPHNIWWFITGRNQYNVSPAAVEEDDELEENSIWDIEPPLPSDYLKKLYVLLEVDGRMNCSASCPLPVAGNVTELSLHLI